MWPLFVTFIYIKELPQILWAYNQRNVANLWDFKAFEDSGDLRSRSWELLVIQGNILLWSSFHIKSLPICLVGDYKREQNVLTHILWLSSANLRDQRDSFRLQQDLGLCAKFAHAVLSLPVFGQIFGFLVGLYFDLVLKSVAQQGEISMWNAF